MSAPSSIHGHDYLPACRKPERLPCFPVGHSLHPGKLLPEIYDVTGCVDAVHHQCPMDLKDRSLRFELEHA